MKGDGDGFHVVEQQFLEEGSSMYCILFVI
jgi:hypothetical protein